MHPNEDLVHEIDRYLHFRPETVTIQENVSDFFSINRGDVLLVGDRHYIISGTAREKSFGLDEEPKHWVKYAYEVATAQRKIIKLVFLEQVNIKYGNYTIRCFRSPAKEGRVLDAVRTNPYFMHGFTVAAERGKEVRIIEFIPGKTLLDKTDEFTGPHERYFLEVFPNLLRMFLPCLSALDSLHSAGLRHGDVRTDHLILDANTGCLRWIDFDYDYVFDEAPFALDLVGIGHILSELVGKGERTIHNLRRDRSLADALAGLGPQDFAVVEPSRLMNWRKLYPYIPDRLNRILMHFAMGAELYYESCGEIVEDLSSAMKGI